MLKKPPEKMSPSAKNHLVDVFMLSSVRYDLSMMISPRFCFNSYQHSGQRSVLYHTFLFICKILFAVSALARADEQPSMAENSSKDERFGLVYALYYSTPFFSEMLA